MTATIPSTEPTTLVRGDSTKWTKAISQYLPADGWTLTYYFVSSLGASNVVGSNNGDGTWLVTVATTDSLKLGAGLWQWAAVLTKAAERITIEQGELEVLNGFATASSAGFDSRSMARQQLDAVEALILARTTGGLVTSVSINGRSVSNEPIATLIQLRDDLRQRVKIEEGGSAAGLGRQIRVRYG